MMPTAATAAKTARRTKLPPGMATARTRRPSRLAPWLFALLFAALGGLVLSGGLPTDVPATPDLSLASACSAVDPASLPADESPGYVTQKIRDIEVGTWVLADNPELEDAEDEYGPIDPAEWRKIALRMEKPDGGTLDIDFLGPLGWLEAEEARLGGSVYLCMEELGIDGPAEVLSIISCPPLPDRPSDGHHLVTGKFAHSAGNVVDLHIEGLDEPIGTTANHPFWSEDRQEFVQAGLLQVGERVLSLDGTQSPVTALRARAGSEPVFNLEVETEHVYYVSAAGVLVHNAYDMHHTIPLKIQSKLRDAGNSAASHPDIIGRAGLPNRKRIDPALHAKIHGGKGYVGTGKTGIKGGHYNNAFDRMIESHGGYSTVSKETILEIRDFLVRWFGI